MTSSLLAFTASLFLAAPLFAESLTEGSGQDPVVVDADESIVCDDGKGTCVAKGNAQATRGKFTVHADEIAMLFEKKDGKQEATALTASGRVRMVTTDGQSATGDHAHYDLGLDRLRLTGNNLKIHTEEHEITARDSIEYWREKQEGIATGDAVFVIPEKEQIVKADVIKAFFKKSGDGETEKQSIDRVHADGHVVIVSPEDVASSDRAVYKASSELAELFDNVQLMHGKNQLEGAYATFNMNTNVATLFGSTPGSGKKQRMRGLIIPKDVKGSKVSSLKGKAEE